MNLEKAIDHGEHGGHNEKIRTYVKFSHHPPGDVMKKVETLAFAVLAVPAVDGTEG